jgi:hypothetical protein
MCNAVIHQGRWYNSPRELSELLGGTDNLVWQEKNPFVNWPAGRDWHDLDLCLCSVDLAATLSQAGLRWRRGDDPMEWHIVERSDAA